MYVLLGCMDTFLLLGKTGRPPHVSCLPPSVFEPLQGGVPPRSSPQTSLELKMDPAGGGGLLIRRRCLRKIALEAARKERGVESVSARKKVGGVLEMHSVGRTSNTPARDRWPVAG